MKRTVSVLFSDISGKELEDGDGETVKFSYRGVDYSIDLTDAEAARLDKLLSRYVDAATRVGGRKLPQK